MPENKEVRKLEFCDIAPYLPFRLKMQSNLGTDFELRGLTHCDVHGFAAHAKNDIFYGEPKPYLRSLDQLTQEITHNGEKLVFTELFEIGDDGGYNYEFDFGNVKLIKHLKKIAEHNIIADIPYLPHQVIKEMLKYHFDISGLCDSGLAIPIHNTK